MTDIDGVVLQVGQEQFLKARNNTGSQIDDGEAVYISGALGNRPTIALAQADDIATALAIGTATTDIPNNTDSYVTTYGLVRDIDTSGWAAGDELYLSSTVAGELDNSVPASGFAIRMGTVLRSHPNQGIILVHTPHVPAFGDFDGGNYSSFEPDGTLVFTGNATVWDDQQVNISSVRLGVLQHACLRARACLCQSSSVCGHVNTSLSSLMPAIHAALLVETIIFLSTFVSALQTRQSLLSRFPGSIKKISHPVVGIL